jgi:hypothetical protein
MIRASAVPHVMLPWQYALAAAGGLTIDATAIRLARLTGRWGLWGLWGGVAAESALLFGLYALWQFAGSFTVMSAAGAVPRARWLWHAERVLLLPSETAVQRPFLSHPILVQAFNLYYDVLHFPILGACLIWLYARHRDFYSRGRTTVALFTGGEPAHPADPGGAAAAAAGHRHGRHSMTGAPGR